MPELKDITIVAAVDAYHIKELHWTYQTWAHFKPDIIQMPMLLIYDQDQLGKDEDFNDLDQFVGMAAGYGQKVEIAPWQMKGVDDQREKMLTALVKVPAYAVKTPWYLKIDTDTLAVARGEWINDQWFQPNEKGELPVFITNPWGYTKPGEYITRLQAWADRTEPLSRYSPVEITMSSDGLKAYSHRIISWLFFGNTDWLRTVVPMFHYSVPDGRLPVPSQDTCLWYVAQRMGAYYVRQKMAHYGWAHMGRRRLTEIERTCKELLNG